MVFQRSGESLKDYIERFRRKINNVENPSDESILIAIFTRLRKDGKLYESIYKSLMRDLGKFYERATKKIKWEEVFGSKKPSDKKKEQKAPARTRRKAIATVIKETKGGVPMIRSLKRQGMSEEGSDLHARVDMRIIMSYLTLRKGFSPQKGTRKTLGDLAP